MNSQEYAVAALRTEAPLSELQFSRAGLAQLLSFAALSADLLDIAKKTIAYGKPLDKAAFHDKIVEIGSRLTALEVMTHRIDKVDVGPFATQLHAPNLRLVHGAIGMFGEAGEICEALLKGMQSGELDLVNVAEETADSDWYKNLIHAETGVDEGTARGKNIAKLKVRFPGKFSEAAALNRDLGAERAVLEGQGS